jgi:hypothetical protein
MGVVQVGKAAENGKNCMVRFFGQIVAEWSTTLSMDVGVRFHPLENDIL